MARACRHGPPMPPPRHSPGAVLDWYFRRPPDFSEVVLSECAHHFSPTASASRSFSWNANRHQSRTPPSCRSSAPQSIQIVPREFFERYRKPERGAKFSGGHPNFRIRSAAPRFVARLARVARSISRNVVQGRAERVFCRHRWLASVGIAAVDFRGRAQFPAELFRQENVLVLVLSQHRSSVLFYGKRPLLRSQVFSIPEVASAIDQSGQPALP